MELAALVYHPLMEGEEEKKEGFDKATVRFILANQKWTINSIRAIARSVSKGTICDYEVEPLYSDLVMYLHNNEDYNISKAVNKDGTSQVLSIEGYISVCIKFCVKKFVTDAYKKDKDTVRLYAIDSEGRETNPLDNVYDESVNRSYEDILCNLEDSCKQFECYRYKYGADLYQLVYVRLLTVQHNEMYKIIMELLGVSKKDIGAIERRSLKEDVMTSIAKAIAVEGVEKAISVFERYVYSAHTIKAITLEHID